MSVSAVMTLVLALIGCGREPPRAVLWGGDLALAKQNGAVKLEPGVFLMGSPKSEKGRYPPEQQHEVKLTRAFWILQTEVTQALYTEVTGTNPAKHTTCGPTCPVEEVSFYDAIAFCNLLSQIEGLEPAYTLVDQQVTWHWASPGYRLPTEAEWEYAARAAGENRGPYPGGGPPEAVAWFNSNARGSTHPSKELRPNTLDIFDMGGNVREWTWDHPSYFENAYAIDPTGPSTGEERMTRGGSWTADSTRVRNAYRRPEPPRTRTPQIGFRVVRTAL